MAKKVLQWFGWCVPMCTALLRMELHRELTDSTIFEQRVGIGRGTHNVALYLGIPMQRSLVVIDTASDWTSVASTLCTTCGNYSDPNYDIKLSTTSNYLNCTFRKCDQCNYKGAACHKQQLYADGSGWTGSMVNELGYIGRLSGESSSDLIRQNGVNFPLAAELTASGPLVTQVENGIMGFSKASTTFLAALRSHDKIAKNAFSLCFATAGGTLVLGGSDTTLHTGTTAIAPMMAGSSSKYYVPVVDLLVANQTIGMDAYNYNQGQGVLVDSGSTLSALPAIILPAFSAAFQRVTGLQYSDSTAYSLSAIQSWPIITLVLQGTTNNNRVFIDLPPLKYMYAVGDGTFKAALRFTGVATGVIGANSMIDLDILFDLDNQQISFTPSNCNKTTETTTVMSKAITPKPSASLATRESAILFFVVLLCFII
ncbi:aspartyl protease family A01B [Thraustotheca clavata]|uniref:Aspartyl protease family A01B n=1 Tax=Thraustotheca clavata TaxID=74557 RepID=A0A0A7CLS8_9STRA|nr:secreted protein [Thraustotheca clavata]OQS03913.1 aspartyl protease family A01B [Thraustotheca clavata]